MGDLLDWLFDPVVILVGIALVVGVLVFGIPTCGLHKTAQDPGQAVTKEGAHTVVVQEPVRFPYVTATICLTIVIVVFIVSYYKYKTHKERLLSEQASAYEETVRREFDRQDHAYRDAASQDKK
ncbi:MAG: hypothetical protein AB1646_03675 [Thermodesulfobacteriota bacterium]